MVAEETSCISIDEKVVDIPMDKEITDIPLDGETTDIPLDGETVVNIKPPPQISKQLDVDITTEYSTTPKSEAKVLSRYLRTSSLASCHNLCKFGHKHNSDEEPRISLSKVIRIRLAEMRNHNKTIDLDPKRKEIVNSPKSFPESKDKYQKKIHQEVLPSPLKLVVLLQKDPLPIKRRPNISEKSSTGDLKATTKPEPTKQRFAIRSKSDAAVVVAPPLPVKRFVGTVTGMHKKQLNALLTKNQKIARKSNEITKRSDRNVSSTKAKSKENSQNDVPIALPPSKGKKRRNNNASYRNCCTQRYPLRKGNLKFDKTLSQMSSSHAKSRNSIGMDMDLTSDNKAADSMRENDVNSSIEINTSPSNFMLNLAKLLVENGYGKADITRSSLNKSLTDELDSSNTEEQPKQIIEENGEEKEVNEEKRKEMNERAGILPNIDEAKDKLDSSRKLIFKKGKIIDNNQSQNIGSRRLKFKLSRVKVDCQDTNFLMKISGLKSKNLDDKRNDGLNEKNREQVVLKHRLVEGKRDSQSLFNNVIEETANKLVESRKSKVKALVGAFESVISLQDTKP